MESRNVNTKKAICRERLIQASTVVPWAMARNLIFATCYFVVGSKEHERENTIEDESVLRVPAHTPWRLHVCSDPLT